MGKQGSLVLEDLSSTSKNTMTNIVKYYCGVSVSKCQGRQINKISNYGKPPKGAKPPSCTNLSYLGDRKGSLEATQGDT